MRGWLIPVLLGLCTCGGEPDLDECEALALAECDIREDACQEHYSAVLRCVREDDQPTPKLEVLDADAYLERYPAVDEPPATPTPADRGFSLLRLLPLPPVGSGGGDQVPAARYDFDTRTVIVVDTGDVRSQLRVIAQAHADAAVGFLSLDEQITSDDQLGAVVTLFLGEAIFFGDAAWYKIKAETAEAYRARLVDNIYYDDEQVDAALVARDSAYDFVAAISAFARGYGPDAVFAAWLDGGAAAIRAGYDPLITSTRQILAGTLDDPGELAEFELPTLPAEVEGVLVDRLGPWLLHALHSRRVGVPGGTPIADDFDAIDRAADNWRGDVLLVAHDASADTVGVVVLVALDDPAGWSPADDEWQVSTDGHEVALVLAETDALREALSAAVAARMYRRGQSGRSTPAALRVRAFHDFLDPRWISR